jgi:hypothetical protein
MNYQAFLAKKSQLGNMAGFEPVWMPEFLDFGSKDGFQRFLVNWTIRRGRGAIIADCGLGKTPMYLVWAENVSRKTGKKVLVLTPLAVAQQTVREAEKFGIDAQQSKDGKPCPRITVTNYEKLHHFNVNDFVAVVGDEASCIKAMAGKRRAEVTEFLRTIPYRLFCTATAAPNDYVELGTLSEALGEMGQRDMITMFFKQETEKDYLGWGRTKYRMKGHAENAFWKWVCSWARACRKPSDLGYSDDKFKLPKLTEETHVVKSMTKRPGYLFDMPAQDMHEEREERRRTVSERCEKVAELVKSTGKPSVIWCHLNDEGNLLKELIKDSVQVSGQDSDEEKERKFEAFSTGNVKDLVIKPKIGAWGLNWQHCSHVVTFVGHSYEEYYQLVRRCWRFGQKSKVKVDIVASEGEERVSVNLERKSASAAKMFTNLVGYMNESMTVCKDNSYIKPPEKPSWLLPSK